MTYSSDLTDAEWEILEPLLLEILPTKKQTRPSNWTKREIFNGILYQLKNGCNWQDLPKDLPPYSTVYWHVHSVARRWGFAGIDAPFTWTSARAGEKKPQWTTLMILDSQAVKNTCNASVESKGFCFYKANNGIKRHLAIDTLGFPFFTHCTSANLSDDAGLIEMFTLNIDYFKSKPLNLPKITILLDHGYHPEYLSKELERIYPEIMTKIQFELSTKPSKPEKAVQGKSGFVPTVAGVGVRLRRGEAL